MGKKKENLDEMKRENPAENNWDIPDESNLTEEQEKQVQETAEKLVEDMRKDPELKEEVLGKHEEPKGKPLTLDNTIREGLTAAWVHVPDDIKENNEIIAWALRNDGATFVFKDGRKYRVYYKK